MQITSQIIEENETGKNPVQNSNSLDTKPQEFSNNLNPEKFLGDQQKQNKKYFQQEEKLYEVKYIHNLSSIILPKEESQQIMEQQQLQKIHNSTSQQSQTQSQELEIPKRIIPYYLKYLKGHLILQEIIAPIEQENLLDFDKEKFLQFMALITSRAYRYIQSFNNCLKRQQQLNPNTDLNSISELPQIQDISAYTSLAQIKFTAYNQNIDLHNKKFKSKFRSASELVYVNPEKKIKYKFLDGFQGPDYSEQEQITFTYDRYIEYVLNSKTISSEFFKNHRLKKILKCYREICSIGGNDKNIQHSIYMEDNQKIDSKNSFEKVMNYIILNQ